MKKIFFITFLILPLVVFPKQDNEKTINDNTDVKRYFYKDGVKSIERFFGDDEVLDSLKTYYKSGNLNETFYYDKKGTYNGECVQYTPYKEKLVTWFFNQGKLISRIDHIKDFNKNNKEQIKTTYNRLEQLNKDTNYNPRSFKTIYTRASLRLKLSNYTLALRDFKTLEKYLKKKSKRKSVNKKLVAHLYDNLGRIYGSFEMENKALHYKNKAVQTAPKDGRLLYNLGAYLFETKAYRLSINYLNEVKKIWPHHAFSNWMLGAIHSDLEDYQKAMEYINIAFKKEQSLYKFGSGKAEMDIRTIRGLLYHKLGDSEKGIADLNEALKVNKNNAFAYRNLGVIYYELKAFNTSCELLKKAKELQYEKIHDRNDLLYYLEQSCNQATNIKLEKLSEKTYIYPNPVVDVLNIKNFNKQQFNFELYNYQSQLIKKGISNQSSINISELEAGLYILKVSKGIINHTFKIIKK